MKRKKPKIIRSVRYQKDKDPENHYREKLMLYTPWRNESTDLINSSKTYQERFQKVKTEVLCNSRQYDYHSEMLDKALQDIIDVDHENLGNVASNSEHTNKQDCC